MKKLAILSAAALIYAAPATAGSILWISDSNNNLVTVDVLTGASTVIGQTSTTLTDIAFSPTGELYGISFSTLYRVNTATAALTAVGNLGFSGNALVFGADGTLYGAGGSSTLYTINPLTGAGSAVGSTGGSSSGDLAFVGNTLYLAADSSPTDTLRRIDLGPPVTDSLVGSIGFDEVFGMARADDGVLYGVAQDNIFSINLATGLGTLSTSFSYAGQGPAYGTSFFLETKPPAGVPEPATWAMLISGFALVGGALRRSVQKVRFA